MNKKYRRSVGLLPLVVFLMIGATATAQEDGGGQSGADFLLSPSTPRADALGGVVDGQGDPLEGMFFNPSILMLDPNLQLNIGITPLPNGVTDAALSFGMPIGPGMLGVAAQLMSVGEFTYISDVGQPSAAVTLFDAVGSAGYAMYVWDHLSVGGSAKAVYRALGSDTAFGMGVDMGATWWLETPHIGQRPKAPTMEQLQAQLDRELGALESEKEKRTREAAGDVADLREDVAKLEANLAKIEENLAAAEEGEDTTKLDTSQAEVQATLRATEAQLAEAESAAAGDLAAVEEWHQAALAEVQQAHATRVADLRAVESERARLFEVVDDPNTMLTADVIISNIEDAIARSRQFSTDRTAALREANTEFRTSREARIAEVADQISAYETQITEIVGPDADRLRREIDTLESRMAELQESEDEGAGDQLKAARAELSDAEKELDDLQSDPWVRRLQRRIDDKEAETADLQAAIDKFDADTQADIEALAEQTDRDVVAFETLSTNLQSDLRRAQLRRELDLIDARAERATERAEAKYEASEQKIYQTLLAAMYENEEKIFDARTALANRDSIDRRFETEAQLTTERETADDDFAFQERFLNQRIDELKRAEPVNAAALESAEEEFAALEADYDAKLSDLDDRLAKFDEVESARLRREINAIRQERLKIRLIYLQTDDPYRNMAITLAIRNLGTNLKFVEVGYPMPRTAALGVSYGVMNTDLHSVRLSTEAEMPLYGEPTFADLQVGIGLEYGFADLLDVRAGYAFGSPDRTFSVGFGVDFALGFTSYAVDYVFRPIPNYGLLHSFGIAIGF